MARTITITVADQVDSDTFGDLVGDIWTALQRHIPHPDLGEDFMVLRCSPADHEAANVARGLPPRNE
jgi:hypothetical protein